jgi:hypothetical protein
MGLHKGRTNNPNGRPKGTPNKGTKEIREILNKIVSSELEGLSDRLDELNTKERLQVLIKMMPYVLPKVESDNLEPSEERPSIPLISWVNSEGENVS